MRLRFLALLFAASAAAQENMLTGDPIACFTRLDGSPRISYSVVDVQGPSGFTKAWRIRTRELGTNPWDLRLRCFATRAARRGDTGVATYWIRSTSDSPALSHFVVEQGASPFSKSVEWTTSAGREWRKVQAAFRWDNDYNGSTSGASSYNLSFWSNFQVQEIEIGGFELLNYGQGVDPATLGLVGYPYEGADADAPWRAAAAERIEKHRKADIEISVKDADGNPAAGAAVKVRMKRHAFGWATAVDAATLTGTGANNQRYREELLRNFNKVATENDLKWPFFETWAAGRFDAAERWLQQNGMTDIHAHVLVWPGRSNLPADVQQMLAANPVDKEALRRRINSHIERMMNHTRGKVTEWDVLNEPFDNKDVQAALGNEEMAEWFKLARSHDPSVKLFLNDYDIVERGGFLFSHIKFTYDTLRFIVERGGPVDGFGFQSHFGSGLTDPARVYELYEQFAQHVGTIQVTEFDVSNATEDVRAQYTRDYMTIAFSHPKMNGFTLWGFWAGRHWRPDAALFKLDWTPTKSLDVWRDLIFREWWTDVEGVTGDDGVFRVRGFLGDYEIEGAGQTKNLKVEGGRTNALEFAPQN